MLLDTSGLLCCFDASDRRHAAAVKSFEGATATITHNYVVAEFVALTQARRLPRAQSLAFVGELVADAKIDVVWVDAQLNAAALQLLQTQQDKQYSLCDAVSFILMRARGILDALTTDHHFEQAHFRRLLPG